MGRAGWPQGREKMIRPLHLECQRAAVAKMVGMETQRRALAGWKFSLDGFLEEVAFELNLRARLGEGRCSTQQLWK